jgi:steroid delta-isomerase-like uncharacterized protein
MPTAESKALLHRFFDEVVNNHDFAVLDAIIGPTFCVVPDDQGMQGPEGMKQFLAWLFTIFPDIHYTVEDVIAEEDRVVARARARATHQGEYLGHPATGKPVEYAEILIFRAVDGRITEWWLALDRLSILQQIGVIPAG